jgi:hypothetical protein
LRQKIVTKWLYRRSGIHELVISLSANGPDDDEVQAHRLVGLGACPNRSAASAR